MSTGGPTSGADPTQHASGTVTSANPPDSSKTAPLSPEPSEEFHSKPFGPYEILDLIGHGGMGWVYLARDTRMNRLVALKLLPPGPFAGHANRKRFETEVRAAAQLDHPNVIPIYETDCIDNQLYFTMKYLDGHSLAQNRERFKGDARAVAGLMAKVARAVHFAHQRRILHRDLKPGNILLDSNGEPMVGDFGLAKLLDSADGITMSDALVGTLPYMSPEQRAGRANEISFASDVYALGVTLYEMITGARPNPDEDGLSVTARDPELKPGRNGDTPTLDPILAAIIGRCLRKSPRDRYPSAEALAIDLEKWLIGEPVTIEWRKPRKPLNRRLIIGLALGALLIWAGVVAWIFLAPLLEPGESPGARRIRTEVQPRLAQDRRATLVADKGLPAAYHWIAGEVPLSTADDGSLVIETKTHSVLELLADPQSSRYRLQAEVCQDPGPDGLGGIYFGRTKQIAGRRQSETLHWFCAFEFAEHGQNAESRLDENGNHQSRAGLAARGLRLPSEPVAHTYLPGMDWFFSRARDFPRWRQLAIDVSSENVAAFWDGGAVAKEISHGRLLDVVTLQTQPSSRIGVETPERTFPPRGGLGLYAEMGRFRFRNVTIELKN
jgi:serine/threonine-protein kinase